MNKLEPGVLYDVVTHIPLSGRRNHTLVKIPAKSRAKLRLINGNEDADELKAFVSDLARENNFDLGLNGWIYRIALEDGTYAFLGEAIPTFALVHPLQLLAETVDDA